MAGKKKNSAFDNVLKTLTAVRATLSPEEQEILDSIVVTRPESEEEVEGHAMSSQKVSSNITPPSPRAASTKMVNMKASSTKSPDEDDVVGHTMHTTKAASTKVASTKAVNMKASSTKSPDEDEVV